MENNYDKFLEAISKAADLADEIDEIDSSNDIRAEICVIGLLMKISQNICYSGRIKLGEEVQQKNIFNTLYGLKHELEILEFMRGLE